jgi:hypothetical protein
VDNRHPRGLQPAAQARTSGSHLVGALLKQANR